MCVVYYRYNGRSQVQPTSEQEDILEYVRTQKSNLMIQAYAGTGKSATLKMIDTAIDGSHLYICFNKSIATEAMNSGEFRETTVIRTLNSLGHRIWADFCKRKLTLNKKKISDIFRLIVDEAKKPDRQDLWSRYDAVRSGVEMARALGYIPPHHAKASKSLCDMDAVADLMEEQTDSRGLDLIDEVLTRSIAQAYDGTIDFSDQCYMPALFGGLYPRFPLTLIDEWQDLSPVQMTMIDKLRGRIIGVGDAFQAIYGFRGAMEDSMLKARAQFSMAVLPLSISFRCPTQIVENVHWRVPSFRAANEGGLVSSGRQRPMNHSTVLCRNNAPLFHLALKMLTDGQRVDISGVDIANRLTTQLAKLGDEDLTQSQALTRIDEWLADRLEAESKTAQDTAECMRVFVRQSKTLGQAIATVKHVASLDGDIKFLTGHKAKGLEWDHVYHLDSWLLDTGRGQDPNLQYVIDTRTKDRLTYIDSKEI